MRVIIYNVLRAGKQAHLSAQIYPNPIHQLNYTNIAIYHKLVLFCQTCVMESAETLQTAKFRQSLLNNFEQQLLTKVGRLLYPNSVCYHPAHRNQFLFNYTCSSPEPTSGFYFLSSPHGKTTCIKHFPNTPNAMTLFNKRIPWDLIPEIDSVEYARFKNNALKAFYFTAQDFTKQMKKKRRVVPTDLDAFSCSITYLLQP